MGEKKDPSSGRAVAVCVRKAWSISSSGHAQNDPGPKGVVVVRMVMSGRESHEGNVTSVNTARQCAQGMKGAPA
jgi:hypothetical protein